MAKNLAQVLKADIPRLPLRKAAEALRKKGRYGDTMLAHITPKEAAKLKAEGGAGTINPDTGLPEFFDFDFFSGPTYDYTPLPMQADTFQPFTQTDTSVFTPQEMAQNAASVQELYNADVGNQTATGAFPGQELWSNYFNTPLQAYQANLVNPPSTDVNLPTPPAMPTDIAAARAQYLPDVSGGGDAYSTPPGIDKETMDRMAAAEAAKGKGIDTPFGKLGLKEAIAALGIGGLGLNYLNAQAQGKKAAQQLQGAYNQAAAQTRELAQPFMQQGGQQLGQALTGALSPAQQQQLAAAQAQAAQATASSGGVAAAQAGRSVEDLRQRLLANQQSLALQLLGAGTPLISQSIRDQLAGTTTGINTNLQMSQQAGQAAGNMLAMLGAMYARG